MLPRHFDVIVAGTGSMGSATCFYLAQRGYRVLGLEQFDRSPHEMGSHAGQSRIIRKAYFEHPDYIPLLERAYENWSLLEQRTGEQVYHPCGLLYFGPGQHPVMTGVKSAAAGYQIPLLPFSDQHVMSAFRLAEKDECLLEPGAGFLLPEKCIRLYLEQAKEHGATLHTGERILDWKKEGENIVVHTHKGLYSADKLILTAGAWSGSLLPATPLPLTVTRQVIIWVNPDNPGSFTPDRFPCWLCCREGSPGAWYGFPYLSGDAYPGPAGMKFAFHYPGEITAPGEVNRKVSSAELEGLTREASSFFIPAGFSIRDVKTCLYTNTPDEHFILDHLPGYDKMVTVAAGFSGHGFKFVSLVGEVLADLAMDGKTAWPIGFLGMERFGTV